MNTWIIGTVTDAARPVRARVFRGSLRRDIGSITPAAGCQCSSDGNMFCSLCSLCTWTFSRECLRKGTIAAFLSVMSSLHIVLSKVPNQLFRENGADVL